MYKVFFKDRTVFFDKGFPESLKSKEGLFYRYGNRNELKALITAYFDLESIDKLYILHEDIDLIRQEFFSCFKVIAAAGGLVKNRKGQLLVIRRNDKWDLPKGKMEEGESWEQTALREVSEECGINELEITGTICDTWHTYQLNGEFILKQTRWFSMQSNGDEKPVPQTKENITEIQWTSPAELDFVINDTFPSIVEVLRKGNAL